MKIYLDSCAIQRPLDVFTVLRNKLEAEAVLGIIKYCDDGTVELVSSEALVYEAEQNSQPTRKEHALAILDKASHIAIFEPNAERRAATFVESGVKSMDALHAAVAEAAGVDRFCSCDDRLLRKLKRMRDVRFRPVSPLELIEELENDPGTPFA